MYRSLILAATFALAVTTPAAATVLDADTLGRVTLSQPTPVPGSQVFTLTGGFTSFRASADLPQINGGDLDQYSFTITGLASSFDAGTRTVVYENVVGTINGYGQVVQNLLPTTLTLVFDATFDTATVTGSLRSAGSVTPPGFPGPIDFSPANGAAITGVFTSDGPLSGAGGFVGNIFIETPAPAALALFGLGVLALGARRRV